MDCLILKQGILSAYLPSRFCNRKKLKSSHCFHFAKTFTTTNTTMSSDVFSDNNWRGVPLSELYGSQSPWGAPEFPLVTPGYNHAVLYHIPASGLVDDRPPKPQIGHDKWDQEHVRMPCSSHSLYPVEDSNGETHLKKRWEIIEHALWRPIRNSEELADAILSYNTKFKGSWKFRALHKFFEEYLEEEETQYFFDVTLPEIAKLALALPKLVQSPIPLLKQHKNNSISLSQQQIASLLANAFFCTFPRRNTTKSTSEYASYPFINFNRLFESAGSDHIMEKLKCICHYFRRVCTKVGAGAVTFSRRSVPPRACPAWPSSSVPLASLPLHVDPENTIEDADGLIQVDFANKFLGGGVLNHGCVQEEIRFVICPELLISMLFTEVLRPNEALLIIGSERYSTYSGYGHSFRWAGDHADRAPRDSSQRRRCAVLAVDAAPYSSVAQEYRREMVTRELNKAWVGFSFATDPQSTTLNYPGIATGNWGCGAFGGSPQLKSLVQMMASAQAARPMAYYTFKDVEIRDDVIGIYNLLARYNVTVGQLYKYIIRFSLTDVRFTQLHPFIHQLLRDEDENNKPLDSMSKTSEDGNKQAEDTSKRAEDTGKQDEDISKQAEDTSKQAGDTSKQAEDTSKRAEVTSKSEVKNKPPSDDGRYSVGWSSNEQLKELDRMDISTASETSLHDVTSTIVHNPTNESPDLFASQDDENLTEVKVQKDETTKKGKQEKSETNRPSRLIEQMQKLDEQSGRLNLAVPNTSPFGPRNVKMNVTNTSMDGVDATQLDPTVELKKRISRKITDYFSKKST